MGLSNVELAVTVSVRFGRKGSSLRKISNAAMQDCFVGSGRSRKSRLQARRLPPASRDQGPP